MSVLCVPIRLRLFSLKETYQKADTGDARENAKGEEEADTPPLCPLELQLADLEHGQGHDEDVETQVGGGRGREVLGSVLEIVGVSLNGGKGKSGGYGQDLQCRRRQGSQVSRRHELECNGRWS